MMTTQDMHRIQETRHQDTLNRMSTASERHQARQFWSGFAWGSVMHWVIIALFAVSYAPYVKDLAIYLGHIKAIERAALELPVRGGK